MEMIAGRDEAMNKVHEVHSVRWVLASLALSMLLSSLGTSIANVGLPTLAQAFNASFQAVQWVVVAYLLAITTLIVSVGRLGDIIGRRRLLLAGILLFTVASALCGAAPTLGWLIAARAVQGLGAAIMMALTMAFVGETVPKENTGSAMGLLGTMSAIGTALGPTLGGVLIAGIGWQAIFLVNVPLGLLALMLAHRFLPIDSVPAETRPISPLNWMAMFRDAGLSTSLAMSLIVSAVLMTTLVVGPFYLSLGLGLDTAMVGLVVSVGPVVVALTGVPAGRVADRFGAQRISIAGLMAIAAGCFLLSMMPTTLGVPGYIGPMVLITAGYALFQTANNTAVMKDVRPDQRGVISGMLNLSRNLGLMTGASVMGAVFAFASATMDAGVSRAEAVAAGMRTTFAVGGMLIVFALALAAMVSRRTVRGG
jgi:MFS family permease